MDWVELREQALKTQLLAFHSEQSSEPDEQDQSTKFAEFVTQLAQSLSLQDFYRLQTRNMDAEINPEALNAFLAQYQQKKQDFDAFINR